MTAAAQEPGVTDTEREAKEVMVGRGDFSIHLGKECKDTDSPSYQSASPCIHAC